MADDIDVHFDPEHGELRLDCGDEAFVRLRDALNVEANLPAFAEIPLDGIRAIVIEVKQRPSIATRSDREWLFPGCVILVAFAICFTVAIGIGTILGWLK